MAGHAARRTLQGRIRHTDRCHCRSSLSPMRRPGCSWRACGLGASRPARPPRSWRSRNAAVFRELQGGSLRFSSQRESCHTRWAAKSPTPINRTSRRKSGTPVPVLHMKIAHRLRKVDTPEPSGSRARQRDLDVAAFMIDDAYYDGERLTGMDFDRGCSAPRTASTPAHLSVRERRRAARRSRCGGERK